MAAHQAPPFLGFSWKEHWSGLPFPSPMHESESEVAQLCLTLSNPMDCSLPGSSTHAVFQARVLEWGTIAGPWQSLIYFLTLWTFHINGIMQCVTLYLWLLSLRIMFSSLNHVTGHTIDHSF